MARPQLGVLPSNPTSISFGDTASPGTAGSGAALADHRHAAPDNPASPIRLAVQGASSFTVPDGGISLMDARLTLTSSERGTLAGTGRMSLNQTREPLPIVEEMYGTFSLLSDEYVEQRDRLTLYGNARHSLLGDSRVIVTSGSHALNSHSDIEYLTLRNDDSIGGPNIYLRRYANGAGRIGFQYFDTSDQAWYDKYYINSDGTVMSFGFDGLLAGARGWNVDATGSLIPFDTAAMPGPSIGSSSDKVKDIFLDTSSSTWTSTPSTQAFGDAASGGSALTIPRGDHKHAMPANPVTAHEAASDPHPGYRLESADHTHQSTGLQGGQLDHGLALTGLTDDDHTIYIKADGTRAFTGTQTIRSLAMSADSTYDIGTSSVRIANVYTDSIGTAAAPSDDIHSKTVDSPATNIFMFASFT